MDARKYEVILRAVECGNLTEAGEELGYTQSGVSHMVKGLEEELGFPLLIRSRTGVRWTTGGKQIEPILKEIVRWNERLHQEAAAICGVEKGNIYVGTLTSVSVHWLPQVIKKFQEQHPGIQIHMRESGVAEMEELLSQRELDLAFLSLQEHQHFDFIPICEDPLVAVLPMDYPEDGREDFPMEKFQGADFIMSEMGFDYDIHRALEKSNITPKVSFSSTDDYAIMSMVANNLGISILPELIVKDRPASVKIKKLAPGHHRVLGVALPSQKEASPATRMFLECVREVLL